MFRYHRSVSYRSRTRAFAARVPTGTRARRRAEKKKILSIKKEREGGPGERGIKGAGAATRARLSSSSRVCTWWYVRAPSSARSSAGLLSDPSRTRNLSHFCRDTSWIGLEKSYSRVKPYTTTGSCVQSISTFYRHLRQFAGLSMMVYLSTHIASFSSSFFFFASFSSSFSLHFSFSIIYLTESIPDALFYLKKWIILFPTREAGNSYDRYDTRLTWYTYRSRYACTTVTCGDGHRGKRAVFIIPQIVARRQRAGRELRLKTFLISVGSP